jgi:hypothetical protein
MTTVFKKIGIKPNLLSLQKKFDFINTAQAT